MKAYFYLKGILAEAQITDGNHSRLLLNGLNVDGSSVLTPEYFTDRNTAFALNPDYEFSNCTDNGTIIDVCNIGGTPNSWNPFPHELNCSYDSIVNGVERGSFDVSDSGNPYGLEPFKLGFDSVSVPINDIPSGGSTGATSDGAFFLEFDETKDLYLIFTFSRRPALGGNPVFYEDHIYEWDSNLCEFTYTVTDNILGGSTNETPYAFLSGDLSGWVNIATCGQPTLGDNPIVTQSIGIVAPNNTPVLSLIPDLEGCCYQSPVLADLTSSEDGKNDRNGFIVTRNFASETAEMTLEKNGGVANGGSEWTLNSNDYGTFYNWGTLNTNQKGYQLEWKKVLTLHGEGIYRIRTNAVYLMGAVETFGLPFLLKEYTPERANGTFRLQSIQDGYLKDIDLDLTGLNWFDGLRIQGFFGNRLPEYTDERVIYTNDEAKQTRSERVDVFISQTMHIPECITSRIVDYHLFANYLLLTDYNFNNHVKTYLNKRVILDNLASFDYNPRTDKAKLEIKFKDYDQNNRKTNC